MFVSDRACPVRRLLAPNKRAGECSVNFPEKFSVEKKASVLIQMMRQVAVRKATDGNLATGCHESSSDFDGQLVPGIQ